MLGLGLNMKSTSASEASIIARKGLTFSNTKSLSLDGVNDLFSITLSSDIIDHDAGAISLWMNIDSAQAASGFVLEIFDKSQSTAGRIALRVFKQGTNTWSLDGVYRDETSNGVFAGRMCQAKVDSGHHGEPFSRVATDYGDFGSAKQVYNFYNSLSEWVHVVLQYDTNLSYTYNSTTYTGSMKLYVDGTLVNHGASTGASHNARGTATGLVGIDSGTVFDTIFVGTNNGKTLPVDALIDELAIFDGKLSDSEVTTLYNSGTPNDVSAQTLGASLVGYWRWEDNGDDSSTNSNSGSQLNGATFSSTVPS